MQSRLLRGPDHPRTRLIVYCAGWGTDDAVIQHLQIPANTDVLVCWDYRDLSLDFAFQDYTECHLVAWSMGVWAAEAGLGRLAFSKCLCHLMVRLIQSMRSGALILRYLMQH